VSLSSLAGLPLTVRTSTPMAERMRAMTSPEKALLSELLRSELGEPVDVLVWSGAKSLRQHLSTALKLHARGLVEVGYTDRRSKELGREYVIGLTRDGREYIKHSGREEHAP
jgi:hypothetical protein